MRWAVATKLYTFVSFLNQKHCKLVTVDTCDICENAIELFVNQRSGGASANNMSRTENNLAITSPSKITHSYNNNNFVALLA